MSLKISAGEIALLVGLPCAILALLLWRNSWRPRTLAINASDAVSAASVGNEVKLCRARTGELLRTLPGHRQAATALAFAPDGKVILWRIE